MNVARLAAMDRVGRRRGQILMITLLSLVVLACLVFFVFNTGEQVNRRMTVQNAADSAAIGGATTMARSMNMMAMNNMGIIRLVTLAAVDDSLPLAVQMSYDEDTAICQGLQAQLADPKMNDPTMIFVRNGIESMLNGNATGTFHHPGLLIQRDRLAALRQAMFLDGGSGAENPVVMASTYWILPGRSDPPPHGRLWVGAKALEDFNLATYNAAGILSQVAGVRFGSDCIKGQIDSSLPLTDTNAGVFAPGEVFASAFVVPVMPSLPARRGGFLDLQNPVTKGTPPERVRGTSSDQIQRGPFDQLFHWRWPLYDASYRRDGETVGTGTFVPPIRSAPVGGAGRPGLSPAPPGGDGGHWTGYRTISVAYPGPQIGWNPYGTYDWALTVGNSTPSSGMAHYCHHNIPDLPPGLYPGGSKAGNTSNFLSRMQYLANTKLNYMWGSAASESKTIHQPKWIANYDAAKAVATSQPAVAVKYTWLWILRVRSSIPWTDPQYLVNPTTYTPKPNASDYDPYSCPVQQGWLDPADPRNSQKFGADQKVAEGVWRTDWTYEVEFDTDIGLPPPPPPPPGMTPPPPVLHLVYVRDHFVFFGIDIGGDVVVRNPANWPAGFQLPTADDPNLASTALRPPRPFLLDLQTANYHTAGARDYFSFLGVAREKTAANMMPRQFVAGNPFGNVLGVAEARVFNNQSWDLWTQGWQARLQPIEDWSYWVDTRMPQATAGDFAAVQQFTHLSDQDYSNVLSALQKYPADMVDKIKSH